MRNDHVRRLKALEGREPREPTAGDLAIAAAVEALVESHGHRVDEHVLAALFEWNESNGSMQAGAALTLDFVEAVKAVDPDATREFYRIVDNPNDARAVIG